MNICVYGAASNDINEKYITDGELLGRLIAEHGHTLIFGGGAGGLMGAAARGAKSAVGKVVGIAPTFFNADGHFFPNCDEFIPTETMRERKSILESLSDGFVITPGGIGTMDEFFEIFTLRTLGRHAKPIAVLNTDGCYNELKNLLCGFFENGFMTNAALSVVRFFENASDVLEYLETADKKVLNVEDMKNV